MTAVRVLLDVVLAAATVLLAWTGVGGWLAPEPLGGWPLWLHAVVAPVFVAALAGRALTGADRSGSLPRLRRAAFWGTVTGGLATLVAGLAAMGATVSPAEAVRWIDLHRLAGSAFTVILGADLALAAAARGTSKRLASPDRAGILSGSGEVEPRPPATPRDPRPPDPG